MRLIQAVLWQVEGWAVTVEFKAAHPNFSGSRPLKIKFENPCNLCKFSEISLKMVAPQT